MKEIIYFYLIVGCYVAHRKTAGFDVNSPDFLKSYLKIVCTYPKDLFAKFLSKKQYEDSDTQQSKE